MDLISLSKAEAKIKSAVDPDLEYIVHIVGFSNA